MNKIKTKYLLSNPLVLASYIVTKPRTYRLTSKFKCVVSDFNYRYMLGDCGPVWYDCCEYIYALVREYKPEIVVETGINSGFSSYFILRALHDNNMGKLYSIDPDEFCLGIGRLAGDRNSSETGKKIGWFVPDELKDRWEIVRGLSSDVLVPLLDRLGSIDMFLHDSEHSYEVMSFEYNTAWKYLKSGGILLSDDVLHTPAFKEFSSGKNSNIYYFRLGVVKKVKAPLYSIVDSVR